MEPVIPFEALRIARSSLIRKLRGWKRYPGGVHAVCDAIIEDCWNGRHYCASTSNFHEFWTRDVGIASDALDRKRLRATLSYALLRFKEAGRITTSITPGGRPYDFPCFAVDSLPFLLRALRVAKAMDIVEEYHGFLQDQLVIWQDIVLDKDGFVRRGVHFSSMRDYSVRSSSCYDNTMVLVCKEEARRLGLKADISLTPARFMRVFWTGSRFKDERDSNSSLSGDANILPFWTGVVKDARKAKAALRSLHHAMMDVPIPMAYTPTCATAPKMIPQEVFVKGWECYARWMQLGLMYLSIAKRYDKRLFNEVSASVRANILANQNILEVFTPDGRPYRNFFYHADEGMLWGAALAKRIL